MAENEIEQEDEGHAGARPDLPIMAPGEAMTRLREGKLVQNVRIEKLTFSGEFPAPVRMKNCVLVRPRFDKVVFKAEVCLDQCTLDHPNFSGENVFEGDFLLRGASVHLFQMNKVTVKGAFNCEYMQARGNFQVSNCTFEGKTRFWEANFHNWVHFKRVVFKVDGDFRALHAHKGLNFNECHFEANGSFRGMAVAMKCDFATSRFDGLIDLSRAKLNDYVYLESIVQGEKQRWAFENTVGERIQVRPEQLRGRLHSEEEGNCSQAMHEYALLKRAFGALHRYESEDWAFYRFKVNQRRCKARSWARPWTKCGQFADWLLLDLGCGYGANPMRAVRAAVVIMLGFALIYMFGINEFYVDKLPFEGEKTDWHNRVMIATMTSVSAFTTGIGGIRDMARGWMNAPLIIESLLGTLLWGLFIVAFSRKVIR